MSHKPSKVATAENLSPVCMLLLQFALINVLSFHAITASHSLQKFSLTLKLFSIAMFFFFETSDILLYCYFVISQDFTLSPQ